MAEIVEYSRTRGIRVIPEFDTPGHSLSWGPGAGPGFLTQCYEEGKEVDNEFGPIDPTREENYDLIKSLFTELRQVFPEKYLHLGGDEVSFKCWQSNPQWRFLTILKLNLLFHTNVKPLKDTRIYEE